MTRLDWGKRGNRLFEVGIDRGVLYPERFAPGVPWIGLTGLMEQFDEDTTDPVYFDGLKVRDIEHIGNFSAALSAFTFPDEFDAIQGVQPIAQGFYMDDQQTNMFDICYRTRIGNDVEGEELGYLIHLVYNLVVVPSARSRETISNQTALMNFEWTVASVPENIPGYRPTAHIILDSTRIDPTIFKLIEEILYGDESTDSRMVLPNEIINYALVGPFEVMLLGDGTVEIFSELDELIVDDGNGLVTIHDIKYTQIDVDTIEIQTTT